jgi:glycosyltransferase involved in cell wall biosynthesis
MRILFLHNNYPGQYLNLQPFLAKNRNAQCAALTLDTNGQTIAIPAARFKPHRQAKAEVHPYARTFENAVLQGQAAYRAMRHMQNNGFEPDLVLGHTGWGPTMYVKDVFPKARLICLLEWYYHARGTDADFLDPKKMTEDDVLRIRSRNAPILSDIAAMDWGVSPTSWQKSQFPMQFRNRISAIHDGVDTDVCIPSPEASVTIDGVVLTAKDEIITYVARGMEPYRGFPQFMEALALVQERHPQAHAIVIGADRVAYGTKRSDGKTFKQAAIENVQIDLSRVHFTGLVSHETFRKAMQISTAHVYLTVPFVLSWSMLEAMSCGAVVVASNTPPVREVIEDGTNGLLTDFFDEKALADRICEAIEQRARMTGLRRQARATILERYALRDMLPKHLAMIDAVMTGRNPALT